MAKYGLYTTGSIGPIPWRIILVFQLLISIIFTQQFHVMYIGIVNSYINNSFDIGLPREFQMRGIIKVLGKI